VKEADETKRYARSSTISKFQDFPRGPWTLEGDEHPAHAPPIGNESVPKIIINNIINVFFKLQSAFLVIANHNSFRVLFDKIASVYFT